MNCGSGSDSDENFSDANANATVGDDDGTDNAAKFPLHKAAFKGDRVELTRLLRKGCDVGQKDVHGKEIIGVFNIYRTRMEECYEIKKAN